MATITTINATDLVSASRAVINTNFANLNTDKVDGAAALTTAGRLVEVASSGVATQTSFAASVVLLSTGTYSDPAWLTGLATTKLTGTLQAAQFPALTGDVTTSAGAVATTLANTAVTPASYGSATQVATFTVDSKGRLTAASSTSIAIAASQVTSGTLDNARTTAASTNTVSAIVARDASGNFAAGTITATFSGNLTGNVTGNVSGTAATITGALALANTPLTTRGDLLVATTATPILGRLAKGTQYQVLTGGATDPTWGAVDLSQATAITGTLPVGNGGTGAATLAGAGIVVGSASLTTANALPIVASAGTLGQSDISLSSGIFSRAGTLGLSATGANVVTLSTNSVERFRINSVGTMSLINASANPVFQMGDSLAGATRKEFTITVDTTNNRVEMVAVQQGVALRPIALNPTGGNILIGTTTDDGSSKLQVAGTILSGATSGGVLKLADTTAVTGSSLRVTQVGTRTSFHVYDASGNFAGTPLNIFQLTNSITVGGGTDGNYRLDVQSSGSAGTLRVYDQTAVTGSSTLVVRAGAGQSTTALQTWQDNAGSTLASISSAGSAVLSGHVTALGFIGQAITTAETPAQFVTATGTDVFSTRFASNVSSIFPDGNAYGEVLGYSNLNNSYQYTYQLAVSAIGSISFRTAASSSAWNAHAWWSTSGGEFTVAGKFLAPLGSVSLPSFTFTGDTNTGLFSPGADALALSAGGVEKARFNGTGIGFFGVTPVARAAALTAANNSALNTGDATSDTVIGNMRTRIAELETKLQAYGLLQ